MASLFTYAPARNIYLFCQSQWDIALFWLKEPSSDSAGFTVSEVSGKAALLPTYDICFDLKTEKTRTETHFKFLAVELSTELSLRYICSFLENNIYQYGKSILFFYEIHCSIFV